MLQLPKRKIIIMRKKTLNLSTDIEDIKSELKRKNLSLEGTKKQMLDRLSGSCRITKKIKVLRPKKKIKSITIKRIKGRKKIKIQSKTKIPIQVKMSKVKAKNIIYNFMLKSYLKILGNCLEKNKNISIYNESDFYSTTPSDLIPECYKFYINEENLRLYVYDIRSIFPLILSENGKIIN